MNDNDDRMTLLRAIVEAVCRHFCEYHLAGLVFQSLVSLGMSFFMLNIEGTYVAVPDEVVIYYLFLALQVGHDNAVQQLFPIQNNAPPAPDGAAPNDHDFFADINWDDIDEPEVTTLTAPPPLPDPATPVDLPISAALLGPQFENVATTTILRHVIREVQTNYSRARLARQVRSMFAHQQVMPLPFIDRALEVGMDQALEEVATVQEEEARTAAVHEGSRPTASEAVAADDNDDDNNTAYQEADHNTVGAPDAAAIVSFNDDDDDNDNSSLGDLSVSMDLTADDPLLEDLEATDWMDE